MEFYRDFYMEKQSSNNATEPSREGHKILKNIAYLCAALAFPLIFLGETVLRSTKASEAGLVMVIVFFFLLTINNVLILKKNKP